MGQTGEETGEAEEDENGPRGKDKTGQGSMGGMDEHNRE